LAYSVPVMSVIAAMWSQSTPWRRPRPRLESRSATVTRATLRSSRMATPMTDDERRAFLMHGTRTGKLATTKRDGSPHVTPIWFVLDGDDVILTTHETSLKGKSLLRDGRAALVVDDQEPPYSFVMIEGPASVSRDLDALV